MSYVICILYIFCIQVIMHKKMNSAHRPCEPDPNYNYGECLHRSIMKKAGCQPHWRLFSVQGLPTCSNKSLANRYDRTYMKLAVTMDSDDVSEDTNCLMPCTFLEYKVGTCSYPFVYFIAIYRSWQKTPSL